MKNPSLLKHFILITFILLGLFSPKMFIIEAANPYITQTYNRYNELIPTQDAYEAIEKVKYISDGLNKVNFSSPKDLFIDENDYLFISDTGHKQIVILDDNHNYLTSFGDDRLNDPRGLYVCDNLIYIADYGLPNDNTTGRIVIYEYDKTTNTVTFIEERGRPISPILEIDNFSFRPEKIAVDQYHTMYVVVEGSYNGILLINQQNRFLSYFSPNAVELTWYRRLIKFLYSDNKEALINKDLPPSPYNIWLDNSGYIYTVTQTVVQNMLGDTLKKVNIGGRNFYPVKMHTTGDFVSATTGSVGNVFAVSKNGFIYEYDNEGNLLFIFSGKVSGSDQLGLFNSASAIAVNSKDYLYILDDNDNSFQIFKPTQFANKVHQALSFYNDGRYLESKELWEEVLHYNSMFDLAHKGIGLAYFLDNDFKSALLKFEIANAKIEYSDAFWEIRNIWLINHAGWLMMIIISIVGLWLLIKILKRKTHLFIWQEGLSIRIKQYKPINDFLLMFKVLKKPFDTTYVLKKNKSIHIYQGFIYLLLFFGIYLFSLTETGFLFNNVIIERTILLKEAFKIIIPLFAFIIANYLTSSLLEGEGTFKAIFLTTMASLTPVIVIYPPLILISKILTYNESFIYTFGIIAMIGWSCFLLFFINKELHNYSVKQNIINFFITILLMVVLIIVVILVYLIITQIVNFVSDLITEVIFHG